MADALSRGNDAAVPWALVERLLDVGNRLADLLADDPACDEWDSARYATAPYKPARDDAGGTP